MKKITKWLKYCSISKAWQRAYIFEAARGVGLTSYKTVKNLLLHPIKAFRLSKKEWSDLVVVQYPDEKRHYAERYRGRHRLVLAENGKVKCQACYLCATHCPAHCIHIEAAESELHEKYPKRFEIDTLRCIYCGMCVEACPVDAIRMDTGLHPKVYPPDVSQYVEDKEILVQRSLDLQSGTRSELYDKHRHTLQQMEQDRSLNPFLKVNEK